MKNPRRIAYEILLSVLYEGAYSNIAINKALRNSDLQNMDRGFVTELVYGTISKKLYLAYMIQKFSKTPIKKLSKEVMTILYMGLYQILYMDSVTEFAAVDESVKLCKKVFPKGSGFVNGVLRNILRDEDASEIHMKDKKQYLSVRYNVSMDIVTLFDHQYGSAEAEHILQALEEKPALYIRANALKISAAELQKMLEAEGHLVQAVQEEPSALQVANFKRIETNEAYRKGLFTVQDISSMQAVRALDPQEGETILDICASPGGKSTFIAELMNNKGKIYAFSSIMRISNNNVNEEEKEYWSDYGTKIFEYSYNFHKECIDETDVPQVPGERSERPRALRPCLCLAQGGLPAKGDRGSRRAAGDRAVAHGQVDGIDGR